MILSAFPGRNANWQPLLLVLSLSASASLAQVQTPTLNATMLEPDTDRPGFDYAVLSASTPKECARQCLNSTTCTAFSFGSGQCHLKWKRSDPVNASGIFSGVRGWTPHLTVATANVKGSGYLGSYAKCPTNGESPPPYCPDAEKWDVRHSRLPTLLSNTGWAPDIISLTEINSWEQCFDNPVCDYEHLDLFIKLLRDRFGVEYRIAYLVGRPGSYATCHNVGGDALLYNPNRLTNLTSTEFSGLPLQGHAAHLEGIHLRRSTPDCGLAPPCGPRRIGKSMSTLIDGPTNIEGCAQPTPTGPALVLENSGTGCKPYDKITASMARFAFNFDLRRSFDIYTAHPDACDTPRLAPLLQDFITTTQRPPFRNNRPLLPPIVLGDMNGLTHDTWRLNNQVSWLTDNNWVLVDGVPIGQQPFVPILQDDIVKPFDPDDFFSVMAVYKGPTFINHGFQSWTDLTMYNKDEFPKLNGKPHCMAAPGLGFSDHCGFRVDFAPEEVITP